VNFNPTPNCIALICDERGIIQNVIQDGIGLAELIPSQPLGQIVDSSSRIKLLNFLVELRAKGVAFDWEINISKDGQVVPLSLIGVIENESLIIVGARTSYDALNLCDEFMIINTEQSTALRTAIKSQIQNTREQREEDIAFYDEFSRLNNELVTLQRDMAKKNAELERLYAEVQRLAIIDDLTNLYNRRGFFEMGNREIERTKRFGYPLSAIMFDVDYYKKVNDTYGHTIGDHVLAEIAARCCRMLRKVDIFGRLGGDEFSVLMPETQLAGAINVAERLRYSVNQPMQIENTIVTVTISLGVVTLKDTNSNLKELLECADRALYQAKESERNLTCIYGE